MQKIIITCLLILTWLIADAEVTDSLRHFNLEEVVITSARMNIRMKDMPQKVEVIDQQLINSLPAENLAEILKRTTNLDLVHYGGLNTTIGMRGFSPSAHSRSYTLLLVNGKPAGTVNLATVCTANINRIEVIKGPYSSLYGSDAMGGVINIITQPADSIWKGNVNIEAGSFGILRLKGAVSGPLSNKITMHLGYFRDEQLNDYRIGNNNILPLNTTEKIILDPASYNDVMLNTRYQVNHVNAGLSYALTRTWKLDAEAFYSTADDIETPGNYWGTYGSNKRDFDRINLYGNISGRVAANHITISPYLTSENNFDYSNNSDSGYINFKNSVRQYGIKMQDNFTLGKMDVLLGVDIDNYEYRSERFSQKTTPAAPYSPDYMNTKSALFAQLAYIGKNVSLNAGARYDLIWYLIEENELLSATGGKDVYQSFNPSAGIQYTLPFHLKLHSSIGTAYSIPDAFKVAGFYSVSEYFPEWDFWWVSHYQGNPELKPESSISIDAGLNYSLLKKLMHIDLTFFNTQHKNKIIETQLGGDTITFINADRSHMQGLELMSSINLGGLFNNSFKLELYGSFTYNFKNTVDETLMGTNGSDSIVTREMLYVRKSLGNFGIFCENQSGFSARLNMRYNGTRLEYDNFSLLRPDFTPSDYYTKGGYTENEKILKIPDFLVFDLSVFYTIRDNIRFGICIANLTDENYHEKDGYHMPGRMISASFTYNF